MITCILHELFGTVYIYTKMYIYIYIFFFFLYINEHYFAQCCVLEFTFIVVISNINMYTTDCI